MKLFQVMQKAEKKKQADKCSIPAMMFSLEPRIMFDAAALATGMDVIDHPIPNGPEPGMVEAMGQAPATENQTFVDENETLVMAISPEDPEVYISGGAEQDMFEVNNETGELMFKSPPDFENPRDADGENKYHVELSFPSGLGAEFKTYTVIVKDVFEPDSFIETPENQTALTVIELADPGTEGDYKIIGGADQDLFSIDKDSGALSFKNAPDYEAPDDHDHNNTYEVRVSFSGPDYGPGDETPVDIAVIVFDVNENSPIFTSPGTVNINENQTDVMTVAATDPAIGDPLTYSISGGDDQNLFAIDTSTGELTFKQAPDFESPGDTDGNRVYQVEVQVSNGNASAMQEISVIVNDVNEAPVVNPIADQIHYNENEWVFQIPANTFTDPDGDPLAYTVSGLPDWMSFDSDTQTFRGTPDRSMDGMSYNLTVNVDDGQGGTASDVFRLTLRMVVAGPPPLSYYVPIIGDGVGGESNSGGSDIGNVTDINGTAGNIGNSPSGGSEDYTGISNSSEIYIAGGTLGSDSRTSDPSMGLNTGTPPGETGTAGEAAPSEPETPPGESGTVYVNDLEYLEFSIPEKAYFYPGNKNELSIEASLKNGSDLPSWMEFNPEKGTISGNVPENAAGTYEVMIRVTDKDGKEISMVFEVAFGKDKFGFQKNEGEGPGKTPLPSKGKLSFFDQCKQQNPLPA